MNDPLHIIGTVHSCYKEKFGIPRQSGQAPTATGTLEMHPPYNRPEAFTGLEGFSHLWLLFLFHGNRRGTWTATVRPPRLGGNKRLGVFATRSPFRPNPIGLSAVALRGIERIGDRMLLHLGGLDLLDGTPVIDIKPYLPYADTLPAARGGFAVESPAGRIPVRFHPAAEHLCQQLEQRHPGLRQLIIDTLSSDPRPAFYHKNPPKNTFGMQLLDFDLLWEQGATGICVTALRHCPETD